jgi:type IV pilus assembly protein PilY1
MKRFALILAVLLISFVEISYGDDSDFFTAQVNPNVLIILDNSNSMDEDFWGSAVGSYSPSSKSVVGKKALNNILADFRTRLRVGLMAYQVSGVSSNYLHNSPYFVSYDPKSYCPNPPPECVTYARTGDLGARSTCNAQCQTDNTQFNASYLDEIISFYPTGSAQRNRYADLIYPKTQRVVNPTDPSRYVYFKRAYPMYSDSNLGTAFCYASGYNPQEGNTPWDGYSCYKGKTGTTDDQTGYLNFWFGSQFVPTDSDYALGYLDFGRRLSWNYVGRTWFSSGSPGNGYLRVAISDLINADGKSSSTYTKLLDELNPYENNEAGYMNCSGDMNKCSHLINAGLTPTAGTFQTAINYFKGVGYTSPVQASCQKNFIIYVTDGLPSVSETGAPGSTASLMPAVLAKIDALRSASISVSGTPRTFDIQTYVLGVGLSDQAKAELDTMAVHGGTDVNGHSYYADNPQQLTDALDQVFSDIIVRSYSFISPTVPSVRVVDKDSLYLSSFTPSASPFWPGNLKAYRLNSDGTLPVDGNGSPSEAPLWISTIPNDRVIKTYTSARGFQDFDTSIAPAELGLSTTTDRDQVISYVRNQKLGDILHSNSVIVGSPSSFYRDDGFSGPGGFYENHKTRTKVILVGANDGMLHAFSADTGIEKWAFIPNEVLKNLQSMQKNHTFYVDSSPRVADVWFYADENDSTKGADEWRTILICGLRKGGKTYFALDITDPLNPQYLWQFPSSSRPDILAKMGQSWSEPTIGKVKIEKNGNLTERWVALIGGGYDSRNSVGNCLFVIDVKTGQIIKEFSSLTKMDYSIVVSPAAMDMNGDGYIDKAYVGDLGGQMWVFDLSFDLSTKKSDSTWSGKRLFITPPEEIHMIYYQAAVGFDKNLKPIVFFGTGNREDPNNYSDPQERFYSIKDDGLGSYPRQETDLIDVSDTNTFTQPPDTIKGWFVKLSKGEKSVEKVLSKPSLFNRLIYFTTYTNQPATDLCSNTSIAKLYVVEYLSGGGALNLVDLADLSGTPTTRSTQIGNGAPSAPVITINMKGKAALIIGTTLGQIFSKVGFSPTTNKSLLYWREVVR